MKFQTGLFIAALGLALVIEGLPYFLAPEAVKRMMIRVLGVSPRVLRILGLASMTAGLLLVALSRLLA
ncbi:MAG: DUF2065 domain-containing protein [bacterium]|nr:MAG: DUF2065 domain-containing protein [bacterium]